MPFSSLPTFIAGWILRASYLNQNKDNTDDHEARIIDLENVVGSPGALPALEDLTDVDLTSPAANDVLQYDGSEWVNQPAANLNASNLTSGTVPAARMPALTGDVTTSAGAVATTIAADAVTYAKMQNVAAASRLLGRGSAGGSGNVEEIALGSGLAMSGTTLNVTVAGGGAPALDELTDVVITTPAADQVLKHNGSEWVNGALPNHSAALLTSGIVPDARMPDLTGDVTTSEGAVATTIANDAVTNAKAANMAADTIKGRANGAGTGDPTDLTANQVSTILDTATDPFLRTSAGGGGASDSFKTIAVSGQSDVVADSSTDTLTLVAGSNITITTNAGSDSITIAASGGGGGGLVFLGSATASASASLVFTSLISATYNVYVFELCDILPATNAVQLYMRVSTDNGSTYDSASGSYDTVHHRWSRTGASQGGSAIDTQIGLSGGLTISNSSTQKGLSGTVKLYAPLSAAGYQKVIGETFLYYDGTPEMLGANIRGAYKVAQDIDAVQFIMSSGNIASGTIKMYGVVNS